MFKITRILSSAILAASFLFVSGISGCTGRVRVYDGYHRDYHHWDHDEDDAYRRYLGEHHEDYRDYNKLNKDQQRDYWNWRHDHNDSDHH